MNREEALSYVATVLAIHAAQGLLASKVGTDDRVRAKLREENNRAACTVLGCLDGYEGTLHAMGVKP